MIGINEVISKFEDNMSTVSQKLHDEREMLRQCRERNKLHAKTTRDRKKSQMGSLENRIGNLVDEKNRLKSTFAESSIASILMSLSSTDDPVSSLPSKIENVNEDLQSDSIIKLKNLISSIENGDNSSVSRDISEFSASDVDDMRRQMNRMHAKKTRLMKKNMTKEMEVVITSLEKEVVDLQDDLISLLPLRGSAVMMESNFESPMAGGGHEDQRKTIDNVQKDTVPTLETISLSRMVSVDQSTSFSRKRKHAASPCEVTRVPPFLLQEPSEAGSIMQAQEDRSNSSGNSSGQYLWPPSKTVKTVSVSSESVGSGSMSGSVSEGSTSEGDISSGSAVHSLLHMKKTDSRCSSTGTSSGSLGSGSGSDESDTPKSKSVSVTQSKSPVSSGNSFRCTSGSVAVQPPQAAQGQKFIAKPKSIQSILSVCSAQSTHAHWRHTKVPQVSHSSASKTAMAVASMYSITSIDNLPGSHKNYSPMSDPDTCTSSNPHTHDNPPFGVRTQDFTNYEAQKSINTSKPPGKLFHQNVNHPIDQLSTERKVTIKEEKNTSNFTGSHLETEVIESQAARFCRLYQSNLMNNSSSRIGMSSSEHFNTPTSFSTPTFSISGYPCHPDVRIYNRKNDFSINQTPLDRIRELKQANVNMNNNISNNLSRTTE